MKKAILAVLLIGSLSASAAPVSQRVAQRAAANYLICRGIIKPADTLALSATFSATPEAAAFYIFNHRANGFVIVSADTRCTPVLGHSENGIFIPEEAPSNLLGWLENCRSNIEEGILADAPENPAAAKSWQALLDGTATAPESKSRDYLLTSTWSQGYGYNKYCPVMDGSNVVVGCVATAMTQIMRYHRYPTRGFGFKQYSHEVYGIQAVDFDTTEYDYDLMPDEVSWYDDDDVIDMVSRFCWHAGITVQMEYQHAGHTDGSGAQSQRVPAALTHFGYTRAHYSDKSDCADEQWRAMIREDIDAGLPIYYSGHGNSGGHAFVLDGYNNHDEYHFNWGWGGYADGFYSLTTMQGFTNGQGMVTRIIPSGWDGHLAQFHTSPNGHGGGTSWDDCNSDFDAAVVLAQLNKRPIWMKEGTYYGDTAAQYAFSITAPISVIGGFAGTESSSNDRTPRLHPTILDGRGSHGILYASCASRPNADLVLNSLVLQNGYSAGGSILQLRNNGVHADEIEIRQCASDSGCIAHIQDCRVRYSRIYGNSAPVIISNSGAALRQSLVANNDGHALKLDSDARIVSCDIVSNAGPGIDYASSRSSVISSILWNNDTNMVLHATPSDTSLRANAIEGSIFLADTTVSDTTLADSLTVRLDSDNDAPAGPRFLRPSSRGAEGWSAADDWQLQEASICINAGERPSDAKNDGDLNRSVRQRQGRIDIGCYESNHTAGISSVGISSLILAPNPIVATATLRGATPGADIRIYDLQGRLVLCQRATEGITLLDLSPLPAGIYCLHCGNSVARVVKQ